MTDEYWLTFTTIASGALAAAALGFPASAPGAPASVGSAQDTLDRLVSDGYKVVLLKVGTSRLDECTVASVRRGETYQIVYLTANC